MFPGVKCSITSSHLQSVVFSMSLDMLFQPSGMHHLRHTAETKPLYSCRWDVYHGAIWIRLLYFILILFQVLFSGHCLEITDRRPPNH